MTRPGKIPAQAGFELRTFRSPTRPTRRSAGGYIAAKKPATNGFCSQPCTQPQPSSYLVLLPGCSVTMETFVNGRWLPVDLTQGSRPQGHTSQRNLTQLPLHFPGAWPSAATLLWCARCSHSAAAGQTHLSCWSWPLKGHPLPASFWPKGTWQGLPERRLNKHISLL